MYYSIIGYVTKKKDVLIIGSFGQKQQSRGPKERDIEVLI